MQLTTSAVCNCRRFSSLRLPEEFAKDAKQIVLRLAEFLGGFVTMQERKILYRDRLFFAVTMKRRVQRLWKVLVGHAGNILPLRHLHNIGAKQEPSHISQ